MSTNEKGQEFDIVFAGGGTSACVAAGRLAAADPNLSILIIERGRNNLDDPTVTTPGIFFANLAPASQNTIFYKAEEEVALNSRARVVATGGTLGGGSSINAMMYTRAQGIDFDSFGMEGWDRESLIHYAKKLETIHLGEDFVQRSSSVHGFSGPIGISFGTHAPKAPQDDFLAAAESLGFPEIKDLQDFDSNNGFTRSAKFIGPDGIRQGAALRYVKPLLGDGGHPNLHILPETKVRRVLFEGKRAVGVEYEPEPAFLLQSTSLTKRITKVAKARKLVVVSSGALGTPSILERSGIGNKDLLKGFDIPVVSDLPGVGENYQDHQFVLCGYKTNLKPEETMNALLTGRKDISQALSEKDPCLGWNGLDIGGKLRMTEEEAAALGPEFKASWDKNFANEPSKPVMLMGVMAMYMGDAKMLDEPDRQYSTMASYTPYPYSRGSIHITSSDALIPPKLITGFLSDANDIDLKKQIWAYKKGRDIYRRTNAFAGELPIAHPKFRESSMAALSKGPLKEGGFGSAEERMAIPLVEYDEVDDRAIEQFIRENVETTWHSLGTCKMAPQERGGVVDKDLNVYGTEGLKCADMSIIPENVAANTCNTALIVGEKAADVIAKELGIVA